MGAQSWNQNACSFTISNSMMLALPKVGAVAETLTTTVAPGPTSFGNAMRWSLVHTRRPDLTFTGQPPSLVVKCTPSRTGLTPPAGQVWLPRLVSVALNVWVWPDVQVRGAWLRS